MNSTLAALHAAIVANPTDRTVRLVYADALDDSGEPANVACAEFIRAQVELETLADDDPRRRALVSRCDDLFAEHWIAWWDPVCAAVGLPEPYAPKHLGDRVQQFVRGEKQEPGEPYKRTTDNPGVYTIWSDRHGFSAQFFAGLPELLYFHDEPQSLDRWAAAVPLARLRLVGGDFHVAAWRRFNGPHLAKVSELILERLPPYAATLIAQSEHLANLGSLKVFLLPSAETGMRELLTRPTWAGLRSLGLFGITPPNVIQMLAERCKLEALESLTFGVCEVEEPAPGVGLFGAIGAIITGFAARLLSNFPLPPGPIHWPDYWPALAALAHSPVLPRLRTLQVRDGDSNATLIGRVVRQIDLYPDDPDDDEIGIFPDEVVKSLAGGLNADKLERLELPHAWLSSASRAALIARFGSRVFLT